ncbi:hypothetical protein ACFQE1_12360 [Halobium palmae]|uniref:PaaD zinc beta ribbon domain-containing protein n=1 Tax=Halobium palmae TaxID=1776492 RepID=A0ABD5S1M6_9EURY
MLIPRSSATSLAVDSWGTEKYPVRSAATDTVREHPKGPGLCRSMHYCNGCEQPFETFG